MNPIVCTSMRLGTETQDLPEEIEVSSPSRKYERLFGFTLESNQHSQSSSLLPYR